MTEESAKQREQRRRMASLAAAGGARVLLNEHLEKLTEKEIKTYLETGSLPRGWRKRKGGR